MSIGFWTPERASTAVEMWKAGKSASEIARALGATRNAVIGRLHRVGAVKGDNPRRRPPSLSKSFRADAWSPMQLKTMREMFLRGETVVAIGAAVAKAPTSVHYKLKKMGLTRSRSRVGRSVPTAIVRATSDRRKSDKTSVQFVTEGAGVESPNAVEFLAYRGGCRWPIGERGSVRLCCNPVAGGEGFGQTYCLGHYGVLIATAQPPKLKSERWAA